MLFRLSELRWTQYMVCQIGMLITTQVKGSHLNLNSAHVLSLYLTTKYLNGHSGGWSIRLYLKIIGNSCSQESLLWSTVQKNSDWTFLIAIYQSCACSCQQILLVCRPKPREWLNVLFICFDFSGMCSNWWWLLPQPPTEHRGALHVLEFCEMLPCCKQLK